MSHQVYMPAEAGPFRCDHCEYYPAPRSCNNTHIIAFAKAGKFGLVMRGEVAAVDPGGCSDEFEPKDERTIAKHREELEAE